MGGPSRKALLALAVAGLLVGLAVLKPWHEAPATMSLLPTPSPTPDRSLLVATPPVTSAPTEAYRRAPSGSPALLEAAGLASTVAGRWALLATPDGVPGEQGPGSAPTDTTLLGRDCAGAKMVSPARVLVAGYRGEQPTGVTIECLFSDGSSVALPAHIALAAVPGAILVAPVNDRVWRAGYYALRIRQPAGGGRSRTLVFCVGEHEPPGYVLVPIGVSDRNEFAAP